MGLEKQTPTAAIDDFTAMYDAALPVVYGFVSLRVGGNRALAEDLTAEAFAAAVVEYRAGRSEVVTTSWLCTVAKRRLIDVWRRESVASKNVAKVVSLAEHRLVSDVADSGDRDVVIQALGALSSDQRAALVMQHVEGFSVAEIADVVGRTPKATESLLSRARSAFRDAYSEVSDD
ncbi:MAG: sigma-70 family RNA polymerase sigma factor [Actinomycetota bacterium]